MREIPQVEEENMATEAPIKLHVSHFSFDNDSSITPHPDSDICNKIIERILVEGFTSGREPLWIKGCGGTDFVSVPLGPPPRSIGYVKGSARVCSLLAILSVMLEEEVNIEQAFPLIYGTCRCIFAYSPLHVSPKDVAFRNLQMSCRGAIRQAPNVVKWTHILLSLKTHGYQDPGELVKSWNSTCAKADQLTGGKGQAVKLIIEKMPSSVLSLLTQHVSKKGWSNSAFMDDVFSSKKCIHPSFTNSTELIGKTDVSSQRAVC